MSNAKPMAHDDRLAAYLAQNAGRGIHGGLHGGLTPAQRRRARHKENEAQRPHARIGRLRRRHDAKEDRKVKAAARNAVQAIRQMRGV